MLNKVFVGLIIILSLVSCKDETKVKEKEAQEKPELEDSFKRVLSDGDYNFQTEYNNRLDTSYFDVLYKGKKINRYGFGGRIKSESFADLNLNNKNEVYLIVENKGIDKCFGYHYESGNVSEILKKTPINYTDVLTNSIYIERNQLIEKYRIKNKDGVAEDRRSNYNLVKSGSDFELLPQGWHSNDLENMGGQYAARDATGAGYYKVMLLKDIGGGNWEVDIKVKKNTDKAIVCDFKGTGYFLDHNLIVPLNNTDPKLKGSLKIRFLELMAAVFTEDPIDSKEMTAFCKGIGSIAGNFKKTNI